MSLVRVQLFVILIIERWISWNITLFVMLIVKWHESHSDGLLFGNRVYASSSIICYVDNRRYEFAPLEKSNYLLGW